MRPIRISARTYIPTEYLRDTNLTLDALTLENGQWHAAQRSTGEGKETPRYFALAEVMADDTIAVPRAWNPGNHLAASIYLVEADYLLDYWPRVKLGDDNVTLGPNPHIKYDQGPAWAALSSPPVWPFGRILGLGCGKGKTVLALKLAHLRARPTLVICHTLQMMRTWSQTAAEPWCLGLPAERHGFIGAGKVDWRDKDIVFTTMAGLICRDYPPDFYEKWGLVLFDEGDLLGATELSKILPRFHGERVLLTATVARADGNDRLYHHHVGPVVFHDIDPDLTPEVYVMDSPVPARHKGKPMTGYVMQGMDHRGRHKHAPHIPRTINKLEKYAPRRAWAMNIVFSLLDNGHRVLFLGERVDSLISMNREAQDWPYKSGLALGMKHMKAEEVDETLDTCDVVWGIQQIAKRGLNSPTLSAVVIQYTSFVDKGRLQQTVGRALRYHPDKPPPVVVLLNDAEIPLLAGKCARLVSYLKAWGYPVEWYAGEGNDS